MRLTRYTDYSFRVLIYLGLQDRHAATIPQITAAYGISRNHLLKVVRGLVKHDFVATRRGKGGGIRLARPPREIRVGEVVRRMEETLAIAECMHPTRESGCVISAGCNLKGVFAQARDDFLSALDRYTLDDLLNQNAATALDLPLPRLARAG